MGCAIQFCTVVLQRCVREIGGCFGRGAERWRGFSSAHWQREWYANEVFLACRRQEQHGKFDGIVGVYSDTVEAIGNVNFGEIYQPITGFSKGEPPNATPIEP